MDYEPMKDKLKMSSNTMTNGDHQVFLCFYCVYRDPDRDLVFLHMFDDHKAHLNLKEYSHSAAVTVVKKEQDDEVVEGQQHWGKC